MIVGSQPGGQTMAILTILALLVSAVCLLLSLRAGDGTARRARRGTLDRAGMIALLAVWGLLVPFNLVSHLAGDHEAWIFGSETFDGGVVENLTILFYTLAVAVSGLLFARASRLYGEASAGAWRLILAFITVCFILMIGEEASWGQHLLGFSTPSDLAAVNLQGESNLHNLVSPRLYDLIYQVMGFAFILTPPAAWFGLRGRTRPSLILFLQEVYRRPVVYALMASSGVLLQHEALEELAEMVLAFAIFYTLTDLAWRTVRRSDGPSEHAATAP